MLIQPYNRLSRSGMNNLSSALRKSVQRLALAVCGAVVAISCAIPKVIPVETKIETVKKDSIVLQIRDSVHITEHSVFKEFTGLLDTLMIEEEGKAKMEAWADTSRNILAGRLEVFPIKQHYQIVYKDQLVYRDSVKVQDKIVPVEVEKKVVPVFWRTTGILGIIFLLCLVIQTVIGLKKLFF